jgi:hypothetical protein
LTDILDTVCHLWFSNSRISENGLFLPSGHPEFATSSAKELKGMGFLTLCCHLKQEIEPVLEILVLKKLGRSPKY